MDRELSEENLERVMTDSKDTAITRSYLESLKSEIKRADANQDGKLTGKEIEEGKLDISVLENLEADFLARDNETGKRL